MLDSQPLGEYPELSRAEARRLYMNTLRDVCLTEQERSMYEGRFRACGPYYSPGWDDGPNR